MENFKLQNVALYSKHHYRRSDNIWKDLTRCLYADGYNMLYALQTKKYEKATILNILLGHFLEIPGKLNKYKVLTMITSGLNPYDTWKYGYTHSKTPVNFFDNKDYENEYDYHEAAVRYILSELAMTKISVMGKLKSPDRRILKLKNEPY